MVTWLSLAQLALCVCVCVCVCVRVCDNMCVLMHCKWVFLIPHGVSNARLLFPFACFLGQCFDLSFIPHCYCLLARASSPPAEKRHHGSGEQGYAEQGGHKCGTTLSGDVSMVTAEREPLMLPCVEWTRILKTATKSRRSLRVSSMCVTCTPVLWAWIQHVYTTSSNTRAHIHARVDVLDLDRRNVNNMLNSNITNSTVFSSQSNSTFWIFEAA